MKQRKMKQKLSLAYVKYFIKSPVLFLGLFIAGVISITLLILGTEIDVFKTYDAQMTGSGTNRYSIVLLIDPDDVSGAISRAFWYADKQKNIFIPEDISSSREDGKLRVEMSANAADVAELPDGIAKSQVKVDISVGRTNILSRIFRK